MSHYDPKHSTDTDPVNEQEPIIGDAPPRTHTLFSNRVYDVLKFVAMVLLPALGTLYYTIAATTNLPYGEEVVGVIVAVDTFLGVVLGISTQKYNNSDARFDGQIDVITDAEAGETLMNVSLDPHAVASKDTITVRVQKP